MIILKIILYVSIIGYLMYAVHTISNGKEIAMKLLFIPTVVVCVLIFDAFVLQFLWNKLTPLISQNIMRLDFWPSLEIVLFFAALKFVVKNALTIIGLFLVK